jgi:hypothetical protein
MKDPSTNAPQRSGNRSRVKWVSLVLGAALLFLGYRVSSFEDPRLTGELLGALRQAGLLFFTLGGLSIAAVIAGALWRSPAAKALDVVEALAYTAGGVFLLGLRDSSREGGIFNSPALPAVLLVIGLLKMWITWKELKSLTAPRAPKR